MATLSKPGQLFFTATRLMIAPLFVHEMLRDEDIVPDDAAARALEDLLATVISYGSELEYLPFEEESETVISSKPFVGQVATIAETYEGDDRYVRLKVAVPVDVRAVKYRGYQYWIAHILGKYQGIIRGTVIGHSKYAKLYHDFRQESEDCIERLYVALWADLLADEVLHTAYHNELSRLGVYLAGEWEEDVHNLSDLPLE